MLVGRLSRKLMSGIGIKRGFFRRAQEKGGSDTGGYLNSIEPGVCLAGEEVEFEHACIIK